jgi:hypothetical protein
VSDFSQFDFDKMTPSEFSDLLPELMTSTDGNLSEDPRLANFLAANPDAAGLVRDLEAIAEAAKGMFDADETADPDEGLWSRIASKLGDDSGSGGAAAEGTAPPGGSSK